MNQLNVIQSSLGEDRGRSRRINPPSKHTKFQSSLFPKPTTWSAKPYLLNGGKLTETESSCLLNLSLRLVVR